MVILNDIDQRNAQMNLDTEYENAKTISGIFDYHHLQCINSEVKGFPTTKEALGF